MFFKRLKKPSVDGKKSNKDLGDYGEKLAIKFLKKQKYKILETNYKVEYGEIDIIARDGDFIVFIEVKYRSKKLYGLPCEAVDWNKQQKIKAVAMRYLGRHPMEDDLIRFDVVQIVGDEIELFKSAF